jgi:hypothetical protein
LTIEDWRLEIGDWRIGKAGDEDGEDLGWVADVQRRACGLGQGCGNGLVDVEGLVGQAGLDARLDRKGLVRIEQRPEAGHDLVLQALQVIVRAR